MKTEDRLTQAYEGALVVDFDEASRFVFLTDSHRGDGSAADEFQPNKNIYNAALDHYFAEDFTLIEGGDNEDLWEFANLEHIVRANGLVYQRLRRFHEAGRYLRLFGNHDHQVSDPAYVRRHLDKALNPLSGKVEPLFPDLEIHEAVVLRHRGTGQELLVVHGHQGDLPNDQNWFLTMWTFRGFWRYLHAFGIQSPSSPVRNSTKRHKVEKNFSKWIRINDMVLLAGHTHRWKFPRPGELPYFNAGGCSYTGYITGLELADGEILLVRWHVDADERGYLHVARHILAGPTPIAAWDHADRGGAA